MPKPNLILIPLFNAGFDFARKVNGEYVGCNKKRATHFLRCTRWNVEMKFQDWGKRLRAQRQRPDGWALAVCAIPVRRRKARPVKLRLNRPAPLHKVVYRKGGSLEGKRSILSFLVPKLKSKIKTYGNERCDKLYKSIRIANKVGRRREKRRLRRLKKLGIIPDKD